MKKILMLCFSVLCTNFLMAQGGTVEISGPSNVEVGKPNTFNLKFIPTSPTTSTTKYSIDFWNIVAPVDGSPIDGNINNQPNSNYFYNQTAGTEVSILNPSTIGIPITFGDQSFANSEISVYCSGVYRDSNNVITGHFTTNVIVFKVGVYKIKPPTISNPAILTCCTNNVQICATDYGDANRFTWTISGATIVSGQGSSCVTITPNPTGDISATCVVKRDLGLPNYTATNTRIISRTARTASFSPNYATTPPYNYMCKGSGLQMNMSNQCGISSINWIAPNCTITGQNTLTPTITPTSSIPTGSLINVSAVVSFGDCTATSINSFKILDNAVAPTPQGTFSVTLPENSGSICTTETFDLAFISSDGFNNGITTVSPGFLWGPGDELHYKGGKPTSVTVSNINLCTGLSTKKIFTVYPPAPCASFAKVASVSELVIAPNPTKGTVTVTLPEILSGNYEIYDQTSSVLVQQAKFDNQLELQIEMSHKLKSGIYILKVNTKGNTLTEKIILNR
ncbi:T9SS type A sorting domain-containing protein [Flavobacterium sp. GA093]|uniref:T9SS type A sorting domain-containing protein n=1 Tax=Flavobacterium hydrocarbonoxydans TaxID=2683249 RepID=A0A6I4NRH1_9FLAO|nr:T9SS type A sorting domain-containing protein [Flavobacterium hydrocarbonoxydans]MWB93734.1 T9SS type A sorting domain-containing protein [Flavobacterium hydrocarbonoxydans]